MSRLYCCSCSCCAGPAVIALHSAPTIHVHNPCIHASMQCSAGPAVIALHSAPLHPQYTIHNAPQNQLLLLCLHSAPTIHNAQYSIPLYNTAVASYILYCHIVLITSIINRNQLPRSVLSLLHPSRFLPHLSRLSSSHQSSARYDSLDFASCVWVAALGRRQVHQHQLRLQPSHF